MSALSEKTNLSIAQIAEHINKTNADLTTAINNLAALEQTLTEVDKKIAILNLKSEALKQQALTLIVNYLQNKA